MNSKKLMLSSSVFPDALRTIPSAPTQLFAVSAAYEDWADRPRVAIVGSRKVSPYGREITTQLAHGLAERGIVVISGLALGVDGLAHRAALDAGGCTVAVLPTPLSDIYPSSHQQLARHIVEQGGTLYSEYGPGSEVYRTNFIARNRLIAGLAKVVLITEAAEKSGSLHTAHFALEQGKDVLAVPGSIYNPMSVGANNLIKAGAMPVTDVADVLRALGITEKSKRRQKPKGSTPEEQLLLDLLAAGTHDCDALQAGSGLEAARFNQTLTMLEITGAIHSTGGGQWVLG